MRKVLIIGNSAAGKSTLANYLAASEQLAYLDLDTVAWLPQLPPKRMPLDESMDLITGFVKDNPAWVIEGCYADLASLISDEADELIFLNVPVDACIENADARPYEPHKYSSPEAQDNNLPMLRDWIRDYASRQDECSLAAHRQLFQSFAGKKTELTERPELAMSMQHQAVF